MESSTWRDGFLRWLQKTASNGADLTCCGRPFQTWGAATGKARSPTVDIWNRVRRTISDDDDWQGRMQTTSSLGVCWLAQFIGKARRYYPLPACSWSALPPSISVVDAGVEWWANNLTRKTPTEQQSSSPTEAAS